MTNEFVLTIILLILLQTECLDILVPNKDLLSGSSNNLQDKNSQMPKFKGPIEYIDKKVNTEPMV